MSEPILSIIIQSFERFDLLHGCYWSLRENLLDELKLPYEVIIADDGSNKDTINLINTLPHDRLFVNREKANGKGPGYTLNEANKMAKGEFIMHLEDDFWLFHKFEQEELEALMNAFHIVDNLELIRLRRILGDNAELYRMKEYFNMTENKVWGIMGKEKGYTLRVFKKYMPEHKGKKFAEGPSCLLGGPPYQYVGNPHLRKKDMLDKIGQYPEDISVWSLENNYATMFRESEYRSGRMLKGWFSHVCGKKSTKDKESAFYGSTERKSRGA